MFPILRPLLHAAALACALPVFAADPQPASGDWAQSDPVPIGYAVLSVLREQVESDTTCDVGLYAHDELVGNLQPGASLALNLQPDAVDVRLAPDGPGDARRNGMTILAGQTLTLRTGEIRNLHTALGAGRLYLAPVADGYWGVATYGEAFAVTQGTKVAFRHRVHGGCLAGHECMHWPPAPVAACTAVKGKLLLNT